MTDAQSVILARITDPYRREVMRRLFERAADPANIHADAVARAWVPRVLDPDAEALRAKWR